MSYPDIKYFLTSCRLQSYAPKFMEMGFDDVEFIVQEVFSSPQQMDNLVKQTNLKPGHLMKLHAAVEKLKGSQLRVRIRPYADLVPRSPALPAAYGISSPFPSPIASAVSSPRANPMASPRSNPVVSPITSPIANAFISPIALNRIASPLVLNPPSKPSFLSPRPLNKFAHTNSESQLEGQMEILERSLNRLLDMGDVESNASPELSSISPSPSSDSPLSSGSSSPTGSTFAHSTSSRLSGLPETFEIVKNKSSKKTQKKKVAKANLGYCPDGLFCAERFTCKLLHDKDELDFFRNPVAKTKACTRNLGGVCDKHPDACSYAHSSKDARCIRCRQRGHFVGQCLQTKTRPCRRKNGGVCDRDPLVCGFAHSKKDARCFSCKERGHFYDQCPQQVTTTSA